MQRDTDISSLVISAYQFTGIAFIFPMSQIDSGGKCWSLFLLKLAGRILNIGQDTHPFLRDFLKRIEKLLKDGLINNLEIFAS